MHALFLEWRTKSDTLLEPLYRSRSDDFDLESPLESLEEAGAREDAAGTLRSAGGLERAVAADSRAGIAGREGPVRSGMACSRCEIECDCS
jgi:hypothetical protein